MRRCFFFSFFLSFFSAIVTGTSRFLCPPSLLPPPARACPRLRKRALSTWSLGFLVEGSGTPWATRCLGSRKNRGSSGSRTRAHQSATLATQARSPAWTQAMTPGASEACFSGEPPGLHLPLRRMVAGLGPGVRVEVGVELRHPAAEVEPLRPPPGGAYDCPGLATSAWGEAWRCAIPLLGWRSPWSPIRCPRRTAKLLRVRSLFLCRGSALLELLCERSECAYWRVPARAHLPGYLCVCLSCSPLVRRPFLLFVGRTEYLELELETFFRVLKGLGAMIQ